MSLAMRPSFVDKLTKSEQVLLLRIAKVQKDSYGFGSSQGSQRSMRSSISPAVTVENSDTPA